jgi:hypothetical protein
MLRVDGAHREGGLEEWSWTDSDVEVHRATAHTYLHASFWSFLRETNHFESLNLFSSPKIHAAILIMPSPCILATSRGEMLSPCMYASQDPPPPSYNEMMMSSTSSLRLNSSMVSKTLFNLPRPFMYVCHISRHVFCRVYIQPEVDFMTDTVVLNIIFLVFSSALDLRFTHTHAYASIHTCRDAKKIPIRMQKTYI